MYVSICLSIIYLHGRSSRGHRGHNGNSAYAPGGPCSLPVTLDFTLWLWGKALATSPCVGNSVNSEDPGRPDREGPAQACPGLSDFPVLPSQGDGASPFPQWCTLCLVPLPSLLQSLPPSPSQPCLILLNRARAHKVGAGRPHSELLGESGRLVCESGSHRTSLS